MDERMRFINVRAELRGAEPDLTRPRHALNIEQSDIGDAQACID